MLVLSRKEGEIIHIGENIHVRVVGIQGGRVKLGLEAPPEVPIRRSELAERAVHSPVADSMPIPEGLEFCI